VLAIDVSQWRVRTPSTSPQRMFCHTYGSRQGQAQMIPGWPYSFVARWNQPEKFLDRAPVDVVRVGTDDDRTTLPRPTPRVVWTADHHRTLQNG